MISSGISLGLIFTSIPSFNNVFASGRQRKMRGSKIKNGKLKREFDRLEEIFFLNLINQKAEH